MQLMWIIDKEAFAYLLVTLGIKTPSRMDEKVAIFCYVKKNVIEKWMNDVEQYFHFRGLFFD